jgi:monoamine oxidase
MMDADIVIIGAGAAGIAAARRLAGAPLRVVTLEAAPRLGGRAWTCELAGLLLDFGCEWLHSAPRNPWTALAEKSGLTLDRSTPAWHEQFDDLGFSAPERAAAYRAYEDWLERLAAGPAGDCAAAALEPEGEWNGFVRSMCGYISGARPENMSAADYAAYEAAAGDDNWRVREGFGTLVASNWPVRADLRLATPVRALTLEAGGVRLATPFGDLRAKAVIVTVATNVLASGALEAWRAAAAHLPLGLNEKLFFEVGDGAPFAPESHVLGDPRAPGAGSAYLRPYGWPVAEVFLGGEGAQALAEEGPAAGFATALDELVRLFGADIRRHLRPLAATLWSRTGWIGGAYSSATPGHFSARAALARPFDGRVFFAGEATDPRDFTTAHGAFASGVRAAEEALAALGK